MRRTTALGTCRGNHGECPHDAARGDWCWGHLKLIQRGESPHRALAERPATPRDRLRRAAEDYADADSDDDSAYKRADDNLDKAAVAFARRHVGKAIADALRARRARGLAIGRPANGASRMSLWRQRNRNRT